MFWGWLGESIEKYEREKQEAREKLEKFKKDHPVRYKINYYVNRIFNKISWFVAVLVVLFLFLIAPIYTIYSWIGG